MRHRVRIEAWGWGASKLQLPSKWEGGTGSGPSWGWDVVAEHPCPGRVRPGANRGLRLPPFRASQKVLHRFTCPLKEPLFDHLEFRGELFQARRVLPAPFEKSFLLLKKLLSGITRFYYPQKYSTFFDGRADFCTFISKENVTMIQKQLIYRQFSRDQFGLFRQS